MTPATQASFVPLTTNAPASDNGGEMKASLLGSPGNAIPFRALAPSGSTDTSSPSSGISHTHGQPRVTVQRDGDRVVGIHIQCSCGQVIELGCVYP